MGAHQLSGIMLDGNGWALVITAICTGAVTLGTLIMQIITFFDARELKRLSRARDGQIREVKDLVNGKSEKVIEAAAQASYEQGREHQRIAPDTPSPRVAVLPGAAIATAVVPPKDGT